MICSSLSEVVKNRVEQMAVDQGITHVKFTNKRGIELPNADWIAGVDYDIDYDEINDNDEDDTYEYQQEVDENLNVDEEGIDQEELDELLSDDKDNNNNNIEDTNDEEEVIEEQSEDEESEHNSDMDLNDLINEIEEELEELQQERDEQITGVRRSTRERHPVERYTYHQKTILQSIEIDQKHNLFNQTRDKDEIIYDEYDSLMIARFMEDIDYKFKNEKSFVQKYNLQKGLKKFGKEGEEAALKEIKQLHDRRCFAPISVTYLNKNERKKAQIALTYLTQMRD